MTQRMPKNPAVKTVEQKLYEAWQHGKGVTLHWPDVRSLIMLDDAIRTRITNTAAMEAGAEQHRRNTKRRRKLALVQEATEGLSVKTKAPLPYAGADSEAAHLLARKLDGCGHVTIPFVGGGGIIQHLTARAIRANDKNDLAINFFRVLSGRRGPGPQKALISACQNTLSHPSELAEAKDRLEAPRDDYRAWAYWALAWLSRKGQIGTQTERNAKTPSSRKTPAGGTNATRVRSAAEDLTAWAEVFRKCEWECMDFRKLLADSKDEFCGAPGCEPPPQVEPVWPKQKTIYLHQDDESSWDIASELFKEKTEEHSLARHAASEVEIVLSFDEYGNAEIVGCEGRLLEGTYERGEIVMSEANEKPDSAPVQPIIMRTSRRKNESASMFVMRTYAACVDEMDDRELIAMIGWLSSKSASILKERENRKQSA